MEKQKLDLRKLDGLARSGKFSKQHRDERDYAEASLRMKVAMLIHYLYYTGIKSFHARELGDVVRLHAFISSMRTLHDAAVTNCDVWLAFFCEYYQAKAHDAIGNYFSSNRIYERIWERYRNSPPKGNPDKGYMGCLAYFGRAKGGYSKDMLPDWRDGNVYERELHTLGNFRHPEFPLLALMRAQTLVMNGKNEEALKWLKRAKTVPGTKTLKQNIQRLTTQIIDGTVDPSALW